MELNYNLTKHYRPKKGWINDPNGLVYFNGYYHAFYQYNPYSEKPDFEKNPDGFCGMCWGHARTKDFIHWEELPVALKPDKEYDRHGCWSGTAIEADGVLYLFYASVVGNGDHWDQSVCIAYSQDGITFEKYDKNPVIPTFPEDGSFDFRDPAIIKYKDGFRLVVASSDEGHTEGRLLLYKSDTLFDWEYCGIAASWKDSVFCECPSFVHSGDKYILSTSVLGLDHSKRFMIMYGSFDGEKFHCETEEEIFKGPDQYAGQIFEDDKGRDIFITWIPGWEFQDFAPKSLGCLSVPMEIAVNDGKITAYPTEEVRGFLEKSDSALQIKEDGFVIKREALKDIEYKGKINTIEVVRDEYVLEVFVNKGEKIYTAVIC